MSARLAILSASLQIPHVEWAMRSSMLVVRCGTSRGCSCHHNGQGEKRATGGLPGLLSFAPPIGRLLRQRLWGGVSLATGMNFANKTQAARVARSMLDRTGEHFRGRDEQG